MGNVKDVLTLKLLVRVGQYVSCRTYAIVRNEKLRTLFSNDLFNLFLGPDVENSFALLLRMRWVDHAVGILGGVETALGVGHIAKDIVQHVACDAGVNLFLRNLVRLEVGDRQLALVVQHFFKVRHVPAGIHRVTVKPAADMIVHPSLGHLPESMERHLKS